MSDQSPTVTILTTDGTQWFVGSGASGAPGPAGPAGPTGPPGSAGCTLQFSSGPVGSEWVVPFQELFVPYGDDGVSSVTYNIVRVNVRLSDYSAPDGVSVEVTGYDGTGEYIGSTLCTVVVPSYEYEGYINPSSVTVSSGQKISVSTVYDAWLWVGVQLVPA